jgi:hypothetical protein
LLTVQANNDNAIFRTEKRKSIGREAELSVGVAEQQGGEKYPVHLHP